MQNKILAWVAIGLSLIIVTSVVMTIDPAGAKGLDLRGLFMFLYLIPIGFSVFFLSSIESLFTGVAVMLFGAYAVLGQQLLFLNYAKWQPLLSTGIMWQLLTFLILSSLAGFLSERLRSQSVRSKDSALQMEDTSAKLQEEKVRFLSQQKRYSEDINHLSSFVITLSDLAKEIPSVLDVKELLKLVLGKAVKLFQATSCVIFYVDEASNKLVYACSVGYDYNEITDLRLSADDESGIAGWCAKNAKFLSMDEIERNPHMADLLRQNKFPIMFCQPIVQRGKSVAVICVGEVENKLEEKELMRVALILSNLSAIAIENAKFVEKMKELTLRDGLTGLYNHRHFYELLEEMMKQARQHGLILGVFLIDIDHFKKFNDTYGHQLGDLILQETAKIVQEGISEADVSARYGGEEFAVICVRQDISAIKALAENLRKTTEAAVFKHGSLALNVTISLGVSFYDLKTSFAVSELVKYSDDALYKAKESGRNKVCYYGGN